MIDGCCCSDCPPYYITRTIAYPLYAIPVLVRLNHEQKLYKSIRASVTTTNPDTDEVKSSEVRWTIDYKTGIWTPELIAATENVENPIIFGTASPFIPWASLGGVTSASETQVVIHTESALIGDTVITVENELTRTEVDTFIDQEFEKLSLSISDPTSLILNVNEGVKFDFSGSTDAAIMAKVAAQTATQIIVVSRPAKIVVAVPCSNRLLAATYGFTYPKRAFSLPVDGLAITSTTHTGEISLTDHLMPSLGKGCRSLYYIENVGTSAGVRRQFECATVSGSPYHNEAPMTGAIPRTFPASVNSELKLQNIATPVPNSCNCTPDLAP